MVWKGRVKSPLSDQYHRHAGVENEPLKEDDILLTTPGIVVTPHVGGGTADIGDEILPMLAKEIERVINGQMPEHAVNLEYLKK